MRPDGTDLRSESAAPRDVRGPCFCPVTGKLVGYGVAPDWDWHEEYLQPRLMRAGQRGNVLLPDRGLRVAGVYRHFPALSPDGTQILASLLLSRNEADGGRLVIEPQSGDLGREIYRPAHPAFPFGASWSEDWIVFATGPFFAPESDDVDIWRIRPDGSGLMELTGGSTANDAWPDVSASSGRIVFRSGRDGNFEIYLMDLEGDNLRRLTDHPSRDTMPAISPSGTHVVFSSNRNGDRATDFDIYLLHLTEDGMPGRLECVTRDPGPEMHARFSPDGEWIVYTALATGLNDELYLSFTEAGQTYGEIHALRLSDRHVVRLTHNKWEDGPVAWGRMATDR